MSLISISDPAAAALFRVGAENFSGVVIGEATALALSAVWRSVSLISGTLASLPLKTLADDPAGQRKRVSSIFDAPSGAYDETQWAWQTPFAWKETVLLHLLLHGNAYLLKMINQAGGLVALVPVHPLSVTILEPTAEDRRLGNMPAGGKWFRMGLTGGDSVMLDATKMVHIPAISADGIRGLSPLQVASNSLGTASAGDRAAAKQFSSGAMISGLVSPEDDLESSDVTEIKNQLNRNVNGWENAGTIAVVNRRLKFTPWAMSAVDAQFLQSRQFSIEEIARWWGVPPFELMQTDKQTSWGTGIEAQQRGLGRTVLAPWAMRFEEAVTPLLGGARFVEFDFSGLERPDPATEIGLLIQQVDAGLLTLNEARKIRNLPPVVGGDVPRGASPAQLGGGGTGGPATE